MAHPSLIQKLIVAQLLAVSAYSWEIPKIPAGRRAQYYVLHEDGGYKFGYDTNAGSSAQAMADAANEVQGGYAYDGPSGPFSLKYTAGVGGFVPILETVGTPVESYTAVSSGTAAGAVQSSQEAVGVSSYSGETNSGSNDASYSFSYDAGDHSRQESSDASGNVQGSFSFAGSDGLRRRLDYEAGAGKGFIARGEHLPVPVEPLAPLRELAPPQAPRQSVPAEEPAHIDQPSAYSSTASDDGSYSFSYDTSDHSRQESADAAGNVRGSFSFLAKDGLRRRLDYEAGAATGFIARGDHLPQPVPIPVIRATEASSSPVEGPAANVDGSYSFSYDAADHSRQESSDSAGNVRGSYSFISKDDGVNRKIEYEAGAATGFVARGVHLPQSVVVPAIVQPLPVQVVEVKAQAIDSAPAVAPVQSDGSYSFSYDADDHSRKESADVGGNVQGSFSFVANDGVRRTVDYEAGANRGFIARGSHLPQPPEVPALPEAPQTPEAPPAPEAPVEPAAPVVQVTKTVQNLPDNLSSGAPNVDGSYSFSYDAADHSRQESSDASGNVRGSYSFVSRDDGVNRRIDYEAGALQGFVARGSHLPVAPQLPAQVSAQDAALAKFADDGSYTFSYDAGDHSRQESGDSSGSVRGSYSIIRDGLTRRVDYEAGADGYIARGEHLPLQPYAVEIPSSTDVEQKVAQVESDNSQPAGDPSYSYNYKTDSSSKEESADSSGNVRGSYTYLSGDGISRKVQYTARGEEGFIATGDIIPIVPSVTSQDIQVQKSNQYTTTGQNFVIKSFLPPNVHRKFGYIYDSRLDTV